MSEADPNRRALMRVDNCEGQVGEETSGDGWRRLFLDLLALTSNVSRSAQGAGIDPSRAYRHRRNDSAFAKQWRDALDEGYLHLEMETLERLRAAPDGEQQKFDVTGALRLLALYGKGSGKDDGARTIRDEQTIMAAIDAKLDRIRARQENVARMLENEGVNTPILPGGDG